ncbi:DUF427 domain-containing protein [Aeromicrobium sp. 9AM]|uniref:DUF427 domain-containing protein n=1 Tax=Aeromicrobium sp. 9AM TaxID=2653126 RepID=UPI0012F357FA|nr:DUF427 domain-containing protein [Aeromicrobium sp. 9AM]VXA96903.1 conserved hypothetical protein [Aeromicrobium sp. 9AM]
MRTELSSKWVRGFVGETAVVDSRAPMLFFEDSFPVPGYAFADEDVRLDVLRPAADPPPEGSFFYRPKGPVTQWYDLHVDGRVVRHAAWRRDDPAIVDWLVLSWQPGVLDRWMEEEEEVIEHPRDPHKRVEAIASSRHVVVSLDGVELADSRSSVMLYETDLPTRYYLPRSDVRLDALEPSGNRSRCPYKGAAVEYWSVRDHADAQHVAWSYADPYAAVGKIAGRVAFYNELVDIAIDGVPQERPVSVFSSPSHRPVSSA